MEFIHSLISSTHADSSTSMSEGLTRYEDIHTTYHYQIDGLNGGRNKIKSLRTQGVGGL